MDNRIKKLIFSKFPTLNIWFWDTTINDHYIYPVSRTSLFAVGVTEYVIAVRDSNGNPSYEKLEVDSPTERNGKPEFCLEKLMENTFKVKHSIG